MKEPLRVGFQFFGGKHWAGGLHYLSGLLSALAELPDRPIQPVLFVEPQADPDALTSIESQVSQPVMWLDRPGAWSRWRRMRRLGSAVFVGRDPAAATAFRKAGIHAFFHHMVWYGRRVGVPTVAWLPDFQHRRLPEMFDPVAWARREIGFRQLTKHSRIVVVSSEDARCHCEQYYPAARGRVAVLRFAVRIPASVLARAPGEVRRKYSLPEKYLFFPGQLWKHKNHLGVVEAMKLLRLRGSDVVIAMSGGFDDYRNPGHATRVRELVSQLGLQPSVRILGHIPYEDMLQLMRGSLAMLNPSFSEGWSTTVEEAKALGVPLILSDIAVHREQAAGLGAFFDPASARAMAGALANAWEHGVPGPDRARESAFVAAADARRSEFARDFVKVMEEAARG